jgi:uncharacterized protein (TIGR03435 family)
MQLAKVTLCCASITLAAHLCSAQATSPASKPEVKSLPQFEVATIRPVRQDEQSGFGWEVTPSGRFTAANQPLGNMVRLAYGGSGSGSNVDASKCPDYGSFDVNAKVDDLYMAGWDKLSYAERYERVRPMIQALLLDRFDLKMHTEMRPTAVYALVQVKGGAKLKQAATQAPEDPEEEQRRAKGDPTAEAPPGGAWLTANTWKGNAVPVGSLIATIQALSGADRIVIDGTSLGGDYDFVFHFSREKDGPTFLDQLQQGLGLKLEARTISMKTFVVDSAEKPSLDGM